MSRTLPFVLKKRAPNMLDAVLKEVACGSKRRLVGWPAESKQQGQRDCVEGQHCFESWHPTFPELDVPCVSRRGAVSGCLRAAGAPPLRSLKAWCATQVQCCWVRQNAQERRLQPNDGCCFSRIFSAAPRRRATRFRTFRLPGSASLHLRPLVVQRMFRAAASPAQTNDGLPIRGVAAKLVELSAPNPIDPGADQPRAFEFSTYPGKASSWIANIPGKARCHPSEGACRTVHGKLFQRSLLLRSPSDSK